MYLLVWLVSASFLSASFLRLNDLFQQIDAIVFMLLNLKWAVSKNHRACVMCQLQIWGGCQHCTSCEGSTHQWKCFHTCTTMVYAMLPVMRNLAEWGAHVIKWCVLGSLRWSCLVPPSVMVHNEQYAEDACTVALFLWWIKFMLVYYMQRAGFSWNHLPKYCCT